MIRRRQIPAQLETLAITTGAGVAELHRFSQLSTVVEVAAGTVLIREGEPGAEAIVLLSGTLEVSRDGEVLNTLRPGAIAGELALLNNEPRRATVTAAVDSTVAVLSRAEFASVLDTCPIVGRSFLTAAVERLTPEFA